MAFWPFYFLAAFGLAYIVGHSELSLGFRTLIGGSSARAPAFHGAYWLVALLECPACFGFWVGLSAYFLLPLPAPVERHWGWAFGMALATTASNFILGRISRLI